MLPRTAWRGALAYALAGTGLGPHGVRDHMRGTDPRCVSHVTGDRYGSGREKSGWLSAKRGCVVAGTKVRRVWGIHGGPCSRTHTLCADAHGWSVRDRVPSRNGYLKMSDRRFARGRNASQCQVRWRGAHRVARQGACGQHVATRPCNQSGATRGSAGEWQSVGGTAFESQGGRVTQA